MQTLLLNFAVISGLFFATAWAQDESPVTPIEMAPPEQYWAGVSSGFPFGVTLHLGADDVLANNANVRFIASIFGDAVGLSVDALYGFDLTDTRRLEVYVGGGPVVSVGNVFALGVNAFAGLESRLSVFGLPEAGPFFEAGPYIGLGNDTLLDVNARLGVNYHF